MFRERNSFTRKDIVTIVIMPLVIVALTAGAGSWIAVTLQDRSFRKNELFKERLARAVAAESDARELRRNVEEAIQVIQIREEFMRQQLAKAKADQTPGLQAYYYKELLNSPGRGTIRRSTIDLNALADVSAEHMAAVKLATADYAKKLKAFEDCMTSNRDLSRNCARDHADLVDAIRAVVVAHGKRADALIEAREDD